MFETLMETGLQAKNFPDKIIYRKGELRIKLLV
jgi:hypothetical protein